jgi:hypothetical protein
MNNCTNCNTETTNPKFCSKSCAAKYTNKTPKRKKTKVCKTCSNKIRSCLTYCSTCWEQKIPADVTLGEAIYMKHHQSSAFALVRSRARQIAKDNNMFSCENCNYNKHVEIAHIKPISSFDKNTLLSVINSLSNLKALCPNCHWEFDNLSSCLDSNQGPKH